MAGGRPLSNDAQNGDNSDRSSLSSDSGESDWLDVENDEEVVTVTSLFGTETFPTLQGMLDHCKKHHGFDLIAVINRLKLNFVGAMMLVNFIRQTVHQGLQLPETITKEHIADDIYLKPTLENDAVLYLLGDILESDDDSVQKADLPTDSDVAALRNQNKELVAALESMRTSFADYRSAVERTLDQRWGQDEPAGEFTSSKKKESVTKDSDNYFESYASHEIHETMLKDRVRTDAYRDFIYGNKEIFKGKVVLDIGCGTGILSMFCAKAGAAQVIAVDKSDIIDKAREIIFENGFSHIVTCLRGAIEDVILPVKQVDIIVSEWMGYCLLYEAMLPSVLFARNKYLKPDGLLVPSSATLWIAPVEDPTYVSDDVHYWRDVYGFDMKAMQEGTYDEVRVNVLPSASICGKSFPFKNFDLHSIQASDLSFTADWELTLDKDIDNLDGFLLWFDIFFATSPDEATPEAHTTPEAWNNSRPGHVAFTTGPFGTETHWKQVLLLARPHEVTVNGIPPCSFNGHIKFSVLEENARALKIDADWSIPGHPKWSQSWKLK